MDEEEFLYGENNTNNNLAQSEAEENVPTNSETSNDQVLQNPQEDDDEDDDEDGVEIILDISKSVDKTGTTNSAFPQKAFYKAAAQNKKVGATPGGTTSTVGGTGGVYYSGSPMGSNSTSKMGSTGSTIPTINTSNVNNTFTLNSLVAPSPTQGPIVAQNQRNVFEIDIDSLEEKPWRKPGVDLTDYFNYGFNEESWKQYCQKQNQLRLEQSMQGKIKVYESKQSDTKIEPPAEILALTEDKSKQKRPNVNNKKGSGMSIPTFAGDAAANTANGNSSKESVLLNSNATGDHVRRRQRDMDDSVIQVLSSGSGDTAALPTDVAESRDRHKHERDRYGYERSYDDRDRDRRRDDYYRERDRDRYHEREKRDREREREKHSSSKDSDSNERESSPSKSKSSKRESSREDQDERKRKR